ncbi:hypothetical protein N7492_004941 [Penicillium capsulatum]|uniref:Integral membrane protein n=1 Tax=Penicillium capsulatum TaxID=69766 RepID=A0A9W9IAX2_9EURO|nr:hypothetical protein N7492_004941 [Penicillium capsulatum]KAJ6135952.1 hypothetical protein N7512_001112 [Penicillium capsulatum]
MASGLIFNPLHLLHVAPLATSTATLAHALLELHTNSAFLLPPIRQESNSVLPTWYDRVFNRAVWTVLTLNVGTIATSAANLYLHRQAQSQRPQLQTSAFYGVGLACAIGHLLFVPLVAGPVARVVERSRLNTVDSKSTSESTSEASGPTDHMATWLGVHRVRMLVADLPAWIAFAMAVATL